MQEHELNVALRIEALETVVVYVASLAYGALNLPEEAVQALHKGLLKAIREKPLKGFDPAMAEHVSAEWESHVGRILREIESFQMKLDPQE